MSWLPAIPGWDGIHPAMVQFPVALLLATSVLLLVSLVTRRTWRTWAGAALLMMALGTVGTWLAVASGHAAGQLVDKTPAVAEALRNHEALGVNTRNLFTLLTVIFAALMILTAALKTPMPAPLRISAYAVFLVIYLGAIGFVAQTADRGGRLVHELGVRAMIVNPPPPPAAPATSAVPAARSGAGEHE